MILFENSYNKPIGIATISKFFQEYELNDLNNGLQHIEFEDGKTGGKKEISKIRDSKIKWIPLSPPWLWLYNKLQTGFIQGNSKFKFDLVHINEFIQYTEYHSSSQGHYDWHLDLGNDSLSTRKLSMSILLSDPNEFEGGDLEINLGGKIEKAPREQFGCVVFPSFLLHRVSPVTKGTRKSLVLWVGGSTFK